MRSVICASLTLAFSALAQDPGHARCKQALAEFRATNPGRWIAQWHPATLTPSAIYGTGIRLENWRENSLDHAREHANRALVDHRELLGLGTSDWRESIGARMGRTWTFKFDQYFNDLPVIGGRADVRVNMRGVIAMLGSAAWPIPANFDTTPQIAEEVASAIAWQQAGDPTGVPQPGTPRQPRMVIWGDTLTAEAPFYLAWTRTGDDAWSALVNTPLQGLVLNVGGVGLRTTDGNGEFTIDISAPVTISATILDGTHYAPINGSSAPVINQTITPGVNATIQVGTQSSSSAAAAHPTTAYWVDRTNEWCRSILGNTSQLNTASGVQANININNNCNAYYTGNSINFYTSGGGCANTAFSTVIAHEWGHGLDARYGGISNTTGDGLSEGWGDILGMYLVDSPVLGSGFSTPGVGIRNGNNTRLYPQTGASVHTAGQVWMGFAWRLRDNLRVSYGTPTAIAISEDIVISSITADATNQADAVREVFIADDDDGNLLNGTPNYSELEAAALAKNLPYPAVQLATIAHTPLSSTNVPLTPRKVSCGASVVTSGTVTSVTLHYRVNNGPAQVRNMHPNGQIDGYEALLPGIPSGNISYHIEAVHNGTFTVRSPATGEHLYGVDGTFNGFWSDDFDGPPQGWTSALVQTQNDWQVGDPAGRSGTSGGVFWADPQTAASGNNCYGNDLGNVISGVTWNGRYQPNVYNYLRSPVINCSGKTGVAIRFKRWLTVEEAIYDRATLLVNGIQIWQNQLYGHHRDTSWQTVQYALPMADNNPAVQIEFRLQSDAGLHLGGWNIDDIELGEVAPLSFDATLEILPEQAVQNSSVNLTVTTPNTPRPFVLVVGDGAGPTVVSGLPPLLVGGTYIVLPGTTGPIGNLSLTFDVPSVATAVGATWYSQVVALDSTYTQLVTSNQFVNLFTMTP